MCPRAAFQSAISYHCRGKDTDPAKSAAAGAQGPPGFLTLKLVFPNAISRRWPNAAQKPHWNVWRDLSLPNYLRQHHFSWHWGSCSWRGLHLPARQCGSRVSVAWGWAALGISGWDWFWPLCLSIWNFLSLFSLLSTCLNRKVDKIQGLFPVFL